MNIIVTFLLLIMVSCSTTPNTTGKMVTKNIPSTDKTVKEGTPLNAKSYAGNSRATPSEYNVIERLYDTVWFQTEEEFDDGELEVETEFVIFDNKSWVLEREMENGIMEEVEEDDFSELKTCKEVANGDKKNAIIVLSTSKDGSETETEYEGYWLQDDHNLVIVEGDNLNEVQTRLEAIIAIPNLNDIDYEDTEKYLLSTNLPPE